MAELEIAPAAPGQRLALANMMQLYIHDFSDYLVGRPVADLGENGRFAEYPLDPYWSDPAYVPLFMRREGYLIGFALLNAASHTDEPVERNMAEFFVARKHRRGGLGTQAARTIFSRYPGQWQVAVARRNTPALAFWRGAINGHEDATALEELDLNTKAWNGPLFRFRIAP